MKRPVKPGTASRTSSASLCQNCARNAAGVRPPSSAAVVAGAARRASPCGGRLFAGGHRRDYRTAGALQCLARSAARPSWRRPRPAPPSFSLPCRDPDEHLRQHGRHAHVRALSTPTTRCSNRPTSRSSTCTAAIPGCRRSSRRRSTTSEAGEAVSVTLEPADAFGEYDPELVKIEPAERLPPDVAMGMMFEAYAGRRRAQGRGHRLHRHRHRRRQGRARRQPRLGRQARALRVPGRRRPRRRRPRKSSTATCTARDGHHHH